MYTMEYSVQFSRSVVSVSDSLRPHELQHARPPFPSPTPRVYSNSCPLSRWCHPTISSSIVPLSSCPQSFPASGSFSMSQFFTSGGQRIGVSDSTSVLPGPISFRTMREVANLWTFIINMVLSTLACYKLFQGEADSDLGLLTLDKN